MSADGDELDDRIARAMARIGARPDWELTCGYCGHHDTVPVDPKRGVYTCSECGARTCFGTTMPKLYITPHADRRFVITRISQGRPNQDGKRLEVDLVLERQYTAEYAMELLSVCNPERYQAFLAWERALHENPDTVPSDPGQPLDDQRGA